MYACMHLYASGDAIAALNVNGTTIHRFIHAKPGVTPAEAARKGRENARDPLYRMLCAVCVQ